MATSNQSPIRRTQIPIVDLLEDPALRWWVGHKSPRHRRSNKRESTWWWWCSLWLFHLAHTYDIHGPTT